MDYLYSEIQLHENENNVDYGVRSGLSIALKIIDKYASEECDNDCEHCAYLECPIEEQT